MKFRHSFYVLVLIIICAVLVGTLTGCFEGYDTLQSSVHHSIRDESVSDATEEIPIVQIEYLSFEDALNRATDVVIGVYKESFDYDSYSEHLFSVEHIMKGDTTASEIYLFSPVVHVDATEFSPAYTSGDLQYEEGQSYMLVMERIVSVYYEHDKYVLLGDIFMPISDNESWAMYEEPLQNHCAESVCFSSETMIDHVESVISKTDRECPAYYGTNYSMSDSIHEIKEASEFILKISINALVATSDTNQTETYNCTVDQVYKGNLEYLGKDIDDGILVVFLGGTVQKGSTYYVLVNKADVNSRIFTLASKENSWFIYEEGVVPEWLSEIE